MFRADIGQRVVKHAGDNRCDKSTAYPNEAHLSVVLNHRREMLGELTRRLQ